MKIRPIQIYILTLYPEYFDAFLQKGVVGRALQGQRGREFHIQVINIRDFATDKHASVDDYPYGGGAGMVMRADVLKNALFTGVLKPNKLSREDVRVIYPGPRGEVWNHERCVRFAEENWPENNPVPLVFVCGRFEGIDERFIENYVDQQISLGDYVLSGAELAVMAILDSSLRFVPGVLGNKSSAHCESFSSGLLEHPQYTRPSIFEGKEVPEVLLSGHHAKIEQYQLEKMQDLTREHRPDLWEQYGP